MPACSSALVARVDLDIGVPGSGRSDAQRQDPADLALRAAALLGPGVERVLHRAQRGFGGRRLVDDTFADERFVDLGVKKKSTPAAEAQKIHRGRATEP